jgi:hypothetical protein
MPQHKKNIANKQNQPKSTKTMEKLIACNNTGARHLEGGDYTTALRILTTCHTSFKRLLKRKTGEKTENCPNTIIDIDTLMRKMSSASNEVEDIVAYSYPLFFPPKMNTFSEFSGLFATVITFNYALATHLSALKCKEGLLLQTAANLYKDGFDLERTRGNLSVSPFFLMATLNNLGHLYQVIDIGRSKRCFEQLLSTLMYVVLSRRARPSDLHRYFGNTSVGLLKGTQWVAGAA